MYLNEEYSYVDSPMINITQINNFFLKDFVDNNCQISYDHCPVVLCNGNVFNDGVQKYSLEIDNIQGSIFIFN